MNWSSNKSTYYGRAQDLLLLGNTIRCTLDVCSTSLLTQSRCQSRSLNVSNDSSIFYILVWRSFYADFLFIFLLFVVEWQGFLRLFLLIPMRCMNYRYVPPSLYYLFIPLVFSPDVWCLVTNLKQTLSEHLSLYKDKGAKALYSHFPSDWWISFVMSGFLQRWP